MTRKMHEVSVEAHGKGEVVITQADAIGDDHQHVVLTCDQVDTVIAWLKEAKEAAQKDS